MTEQERARVLRMIQALRKIGYSRHSNLPRFGSKAQIARWGLGEDDLPEKERTIYCTHPAKCPCANSD